MIRESYVNNYFITNILYFPTKDSGDFISTFFDKIVNNKDDDTYDIILHNI